MDQGSLAAFAAASVLIELTPGPNMTWLALLAATEGRRAGLAAVAGVAVGLTGLAVAAALGLSVLVAEVPAVFEALRWAGAVYLFWLAWDAWRSAAVVGTVAPARLASRFGRGVLTNLLNPKAAVFYLAVLPPFLPSAPGPGDVLVFSAVYVGVATAIHAAIVFLAGGLTRFLGPPERERRVRHAMALALAGVGVWLLWPA